MTQYLITCRSLTQAQRTARLLEKHGINAAVTKIPQELSQRGCTYAVSLRRKFEEAVTILRKNDLLNGKLYVRSGESYTEVTV
ncbi:MAG: DUF3343 domain-containing protein [Oscillospiraceae bacterium]|nr:DUF3343 domain-containing protein [Oscillospiraceae bacterium]